MTWHYLTGAPMRARELVASGTILRFQTVSTHFSIPPSKDWKGAVVVLRKFEFDSELRRISVVIGEMGEEGWEDIMMLVKGAPERYCEV